MYKVNCVAPTFGHVTFMNNEIKEMPIVELQTKSRDLRMELFNLNLQKSMGTLEKSHRIGQIRKDIARVETMLTRIRNQAVQA